MILLPPPPLQKITLPGIDDSLQINVLREDLVHPYLGGNKYRKLKYNLRHFIDSGKKYIVTFGGAYSNHLIATTTAGQMLSIPVIAIVRGENASNPCLDYVRSCGATLIFTDRENYRHKDEPEMVQELLQTQLPELPVADCFIIPEGGSNTYAIKGAAEIGDDLPECEHVFLPAGTGGTAAGLSIALKNTQRLHAVSVLKAGDSIEEKIKELGGKTDQIIFHHEFHFGGYAKVTDELLNFCTEFRNHTSIPIEPVYSGKMFFAFFQLAKNGYFKKGASIVLVHTGGVYSFYPYFQKTSKKKVEY